MTPHISFQANSCSLALLDQRFLPHKEEFFICSTCEDIIFALQAMVVRGAPAIGVTAAFGCVIAANQLSKAHATQPQNWESLLEEKLIALALARPTAVNLHWAVTYMRKIWREARIKNLSSLVTFWGDKANALLEEDIETNKIIGSHGGKIIPQNACVMTHCNAGALATGGFGTALGVIYAAHLQGKNVRVIANETRPFLQGARLTAYELQKEGVPVTVACDNACGLLMKKGMVDLVVVGADRIAANGDTANKIGTYSVALLAHAHSIPFYVAAPLNTIDLSMLTGDGIPIEERTPDEVTTIEGARITPIGVPVLNFAFDVTPAHLIEGIITEQGLLTAPYTESILAAYKRAEGNNK